MALYHKWDIKNGFAYAIQFFSLISDSLGSVLYEGRLKIILLLQVRREYSHDFEPTFIYIGSDL